MDHRKTFTSSDARYVDFRRNTVVSGRANPPSALSKIVKPTVDTGTKGAEPRRRPIAYRAYQSALAPAGILSLLIVVLCVGHPETALTAQSTTTIDIGLGASAVAPAEFDLQEHWAMVPDPTAQNGLALQHSGLPASDQRFALAVHKQAFLKNAEISLRLRTDMAQSDRAAGVVLRLSSPQDYYLIQMDARREEILLSRVNGDASEEIASADAEITSHDWHSLTVRVVDNEFTVSFDGKWAFTGFDKTLVQPGSVALWTKGDGVTRFDSITIIPLAVSEETHPATE